MHATGTLGPTLLSLAALAATLLAAPPLHPAPSRASDAAPPPPESGRELYLRACAGCHGADGTGAPATQVAFDVLLPDLTDCDFAAREPDADWFAVTHDGGPARGFAAMMPAFGEALTDEEIQATLDYVRSLCGDDAWPRGELNLPRAMVTEKAYPEDEAVLTTAVDVEGAGAVMNEIVYEQRFGPRSQFEIVVPFGFRERDDGRWDGGALGDVALGVKHDLFHSLRSGSILSVAGEVKLPTGDDDTGFGSGTVAVEPFVAFGQILPADAFVQFQGGVEVPLDRDRGADEAFWRGALGRSFTQGRFGRTWTPMVELLGARELTSGAETQWDVLPQLQVTLNTRQHLMANLAVRIPVDDASRDTEVLVYLLWDWFDGGLLDGW